MIRILTVCFLAGLLTNCKNDQPFNSELWKKKGLDWQITEFREVMVSDLLNSDTLTGLSKSELIQLLGEPELVERNKFIYLVREKYDWDIDPTYIKNLVIEIDSLEGVVDYQIEQYK